MTSLSLPETEAPGDTDGRVGTFRRALPPNPHLCPQRRGGGPGNTFVLVPGYEMQEKQL